MKTIVISAVNLRKGGTLTILRQCLAYLSAEAPKQGWRIIALVHKQELADYPNIEYIELPWSISGWLKRLWCEYVTMHSISKRIGEVDLWLSLHDTSPRVVAKRQAVYCHTSFPFYPADMGDLKYDYKIPIFGYMLRFAYRINIHSNRYLVAQQRWMCEGFHRMFDVPMEKMVYAPPPLNISIPEFTALQPSAPYTFFYAATPDTHKEFQTLGRATALLEEQVGKGKFQVIITIKGDENKYAQWIHQEWGKVESLKFAGFMDKPTLYAHYDMADCLVFPSRIESSPMPVTEYMATKQRQGRMILSDLPYAHETAAGSACTAFVPPKDAEALAQAMHTALEGGSQGFGPVPYPEALEHTARDWDQLFSLLLA